MRYNVLLALRCLTVPTFFVVGAFCCANWARSVRSALTCWADVVNIRSARAFVNSILEIAKSTFSPKLSDKARALSSNCASFYACCPALYMRDPAFMPLLS